MECQGPDDTIISKHDKYLISLEKQNKYLKGLNTKSKSAEELEKREKAFSPYVNGANAVQCCFSPRKKHRKLSSTVHKSRASLTCSKDFHQSVLFTPRPKSASNLPTQSVSIRTRKFWGQGSIQIKADGGDTFRAVRGNLDHSYVDDFEECDSSDENIVETFDRQFEGSEDEEIIPEAVSTRKCWNDAPQVSSGDVVCEHIFETANCLNINFDDIPILGQTNRLNIS
uniref:Protein KIAA0556-like n=1 Tax=Phallusia mammillata TaxID=59560 RepID=A0A6F9DF07_9ASCI|nr:protein KIAA0556-like [Phallusia mammillata]